MRFRNVKTSGLLKNVLDQGGGNAMIHYRKKADVLKGVT